MTDFENKTTRLQEQTDTLMADLADVRSALSAATGKTAELLAIAQEAGVTAVSIGKIHPRVSNEHWHYGGSAIYTPPSEKVGGSPAAWFIAQQAGISWGCGNPGQHQADTSQLVDGVYECKGGLWSRIDLQAVES